jgi:uncharacterized protein YjiS (DUF1127 family)
MTRLTELSGTGAGTTAERSLDAVGRWSGLRALGLALRRRLQHRRTLNALTQLDDRLLRDIGVSRADIEATAAFCCESESEGTPSVWQRLGAWLSRERRRRQTVRELSAMPDEILADVGIERAEIPVVAAALVSDRPAAAAGQGAQVARDLPAPAALSASVLAFIAVRRSAQQAANTNISRPAA